MRGFHTLMHDTPSLFSEAAENGLDQAPPAALGAESHRLHTVSAQVESPSSPANTSGMSVNVSSALQRQSPAWVVSPTPPLPRPKPVSGSLRMLSVSRIEANKRIDWLIRSLATLENSQNPLSSEIDWHFDIAGKGSGLAAPQNHGC